MASACHSDRRTGPGVHLPAAFPYGRCMKTDIHGRQHLKENRTVRSHSSIATTTSAKGWSWFALYLMGLARPEEVKPFFMLRNLQRNGQNDADGRPIFVVRRP